MGKKCVIAQRISSTKQTVDQSDSSSLLNILDWGSTLVGIKLKLLATLLNNSTAKTQILVSKILYMACQKS